VIAVKFAKQKHGLEAHKSLITYVKIQNIVSSNFEDFLTQSLKHPVKHNGTLLDAK